jgi:hypothetical protein
MTDRDRGRSVTIRGAGDGRAISDSVGYLLVFSIIITTTGMVYVGGYQGLTEVRDFRQMENSQRAFEVMATNMEDITLRDAPRRTTELKLSGNTLTFADDVRVQVAIFPTGEPGEKRIVENVTLEPLVLRAGPEAAVTYSSGAIFRRSPGGVAMVSEPSMILRQDRLVVPVVETQPVGTSQVEGSASTTVGVRAELVARESLVTNSTGTTIWLNISTPRADAWRQYVRQHTESSWRDCPAGENNATRVRCKLRGLDHVFVSRIAVEVTYEN